MKAILLNNKIVLLICIFLAAIFSHLPACAALNSSDNGIIYIETALAANVFHAGEETTFAVIINIKDGFHINADRNQVTAVDNFFPYSTQIFLGTSDKSIKLGSPIFPKPHKLKVSYSSERLSLFSGKTAVFIPLKIGSDAKIGTHEIRGLVKYQVCSKNRCFFPNQVGFIQKITIADPETSSVKINNDIFAEYKRKSEELEFKLFSSSFYVNSSSMQGFILILLTAFFGGFLLNLTPCVLPLIPVKISGILSASENSRRRSIALGMSMFAGIVCFWVLLGTMISVISGFTTANQLFQYPVFTICVGIIVGIMALGMWDVFAVNLPGFLYRFNPNTKSAAGAFFIGILTAIFSTPCTAPFMGTAAAWAATQSPAMSLSVFAVIGIGMAAPYLILSVNPLFLKKIPKTGPASILIKQTMGLFMLAAAAFFIGNGISSTTAVPSEPPDKTYWWAVVFFCSAAVFWAGYKASKISVKKITKICFAVFSIIAVTAIISAGFKLVQKEPVNWIYYTKERFGKALSEKKKIVIVFTAQWCINCKALEHGVLRDPEIVSLLSGKDVIPIKVDITANNPEGKKKLRQVGSLTIPFIVVYSPDHEILFKGDFYTSKQLRKVLLR